MKRLVISVALLPLAIHYGPMALVAWLVLQPYLIGSGFSQRSGI